MHIHRTRVCVKWNIIRLYSGKWAEGQEDDQRLLPQCLLGHRLHAFQEHHAPRYQSTFFTIQP